MGEVADDQAAELHLGRAGDKAARLPYNRTVDHDDRVAAPARLGRAVDHRAGAGDGGEGTNGKDAHGAGADAEVDAGAFGRVRRQQGVAQRAGGVADPVAAVARRRHHEDRRLPAAILRGGGAEEGQAARRRQGQKDQQDDHESDQSEEGEPRQGSEERPHSDSRRPLACEAGRRRRPPRSIVWAPSARGQKTSNRDQPLLQPLRHRERLAARRDDPEEVAGRDG